MYLGLYIYPADESLQNCASTMASEISTSRTPLGGGIRISEFLDSIGLAIEGGDQNCESLEASRVGFWWKDGRMRGFEDNAAERTPLFK